jgi:hypothetical protein
LTIYYYAKTVQCSDIAAADINLATTLDELQSQANGERGISSVRTVISYLRSGDRETAAIAIRNEWDKISSYPEISEHLIVEGLFVPYDPSKVE